MSSFLSKSLRVKPSTTVRVPIVPVRQATSAQQLQLRNYGSSLEPNEDERVYPAYIHPISKVVLQHLQDSRSGWLMNQGLHRGLRLKSNGTFLLNFPGRKGSDVGKIWTSHDPATKKHWLIVYRNQFNAKYLLAEGQCEEKEQNGNNNNNSDAEAEILSMDDEAIRKQIQSAVDKMVRLVPPPANSKY